MGGRGLFVLLLLCTPPAAIGVLMLARTGDSPAGRLFTWGAAATVLLGTAVLAGAAIAAESRGSPSW
jgi:hypothetical protein